VENNLPSSIKSFLRKNDFKVIELLQSNERKKTYVLKIYKNGDLFIAKVIDMDAPVKIKHLFSKELKFYIENRIEYIPKLYEYTDNIMVLEYLDGVTLREYLILNQTNSIMPELLKSIDMFYKEIVFLHQNSNDISFENAYLYLSTLIFSGPIQMKEVKKNPISKVINRVLFYILKRKLKTILRRVDVTTLKSGFSHSDFHFNNIIIDNGMIKFIDFENIEYRGSFDFDILYLAAILENSCSSKIDIVTLEQYINDNFSKYRDLIGILNLYRFAISLNPRFLNHTRINHIVGLKRIKLLFTIILAYERI